MSDYWIVYEQETGDERGRGSGPDGCAADQVPPKGRALMLLSKAAWDSYPLDLTMVKLHLAAALDVEAEMLRAHWITPGSGQAMGYMRKEERARQHLAGEAATPILAIEAGLRGMTTQALAAEIVATADAWEVVEGTLNGHRVAAKEQIAAATNLAEIAAARRVDWPSILNALTA